MANRSSGVGDARRPWILARTISDAQGGTDDSIVNEAGGSDYGAYGEETGRQDMHFQELRFPWWKIALIILAVILGIVLVISVITGSSDFCSRFLFQF